MQAVCAVAQEDEQPGTAQVAAVEVVNGVRRFVGPHRMGRICALRGSAPSPRAQTPGLPDRRQIAPVPTGGEPRCSPTTGESAGATKAHGLDRR